MVLKDEIGMFLIYLATVLWIDLILLIPFKLMNVPHEWMLGLMYLFSIITSVYLSIHRDMFKKVYDKVL